MATLVEKGKPVRMNLQLAEGEEVLPKVVKSVVKNSLGQTIGETQLVHVGGGLFKDSSFLMPDEQEITVQYTVYEADGIEKDSEYGVATESFNLTGVGSGGNSGTGGIFHGMEYVIEVDEVCHD